MAPSTSPLLSRYAATARPTKAPQSAAQRALQAYHAAGTGQPYSLLHFAWVEGARLNDHHCADGDVFPHQLSFQDGSVIIWNHDTGQYLASPAIPTTTTH